MGDAAERSGLVFSRKCENIYLLFSTSISPARSSTWMCSPARADATVRHRCFSWVLNTLWRQCLQAARKGRRRLRPYSGCRLPSADSTICVRCGSRSWLFRSLGTLRAYLMPVIRDFVRPVQQCRPEELLLGESPAIRRIRE